MKLVGENGIIMKKTALKGLSLVFFIYFIFNSFTLAAAPLDSRSTEKQLGRL